MAERTHDDLKLVARLLRGDDEAFNTFVDEYYPRLYRFAYPRMGSDVEAAQDVVQGTFEKVLPNLGSYRGEAALFSWLCSFCRFEIAAAWRKRAREGPRVELTEDSAEVRAALESLAMSETGPEDELVRKELARLVRVALDYLPPNYGKALEWKYLRGLPVREIADRLGLSAKAAESLLTRARNAFRDAFGELSGKWI